jgi:hypothetical protein
LAGNEDLSLRGNTHGLAMPGASSAIRPLHEKFSFAPLSNGYQALLFVFRIDFVEKKSNVF